MAMDMNIVNATKDLNGPNGGFVDHSKAFDPLLKEAGRRTDAAARTQEAERRYQRGKKNAAEDRVRSMIDNMPSPDVSKVNDKLRPELQKELLALKQDYANNAKILADADPSSEEYLNAKISMDNAMGGLNSINDGLVKDKEDNESYLADFDNGLISESVSDADKTILAYTRGGQYDSVYFENGKKNYVWTDPATGEQQVTNEEDIPNYSLENAEAGAAYIEMWTKATGNGAKYGMAHDEATTNIKLAQLYKKIGRDGILSMAYDDIGGTGDSFVENWEKNNPGSPIDWRDGANEEQLKQELSSYLNGVMKTSVDQSVGNYNARQRAKDKKDDPIITAKPSFSNWMVQNSTNPALTEQDFQNNVFLGTGLKIVNMGGTFGIFDLDENRGYRDATSAEKKNEFVANGQITYLASGIENLNLGKDGKMSRILEMLFKNGKIK